MRRSVTAALVALFGLLAVSSPALARLGFPDPATERAAVIEDVYYQIMLAGIIVFVVVFALLAFILLRYREKGGKGRATYEKERDNIKAEAAWTIIPLIIVMWVGVISYQALEELETLDGSTPEADLVIDIIASQYTWTAQYADSGVRVFANANSDLSKIDDFVIPADTSILFRVTATDVIHSFNVVDLGQTLDAVPGQINELFVRHGFPEGQYFTQCKEDCLTPGHSWMRAQVTAVPMQDYLAWTEETLAGAAAGLQQNAPVFFEQDGLRALKGTQLARGASIIVQVGNNQSAPHTFTFGEESMEILPGQLGVFEYAPDAVGQVTLSVDTGESLVFDVVEPTVIDVELGAFVISPDSLDMEAGGLYVLAVENTHNTAHNLYIGMSGGDGVTDAIWNTPTVGPGESVGLLVQPREASSLEMWCQIPGHYAAGMYGDIVIV